MQAPYSVGLAEAQVGLGAPQLIPHPPPIRHEPWMPSRDWMLLSQVALEPATKLYNCAAGSSGAGGGGVEGDEDEDAGAPERHAPGRLGLAEAQFAPGLPQVTPQPPPMVQAAEKPSISRMERSQSAIEPATKLCIELDAAATGAGAGAADPAEVGSRQAPYAEGFADWQVALGFPQVTPQPPPMVQTPAVPKAARILFSQSALLPATKLRRDEEPEAAAAPDAPEGSADLDDSESDFSGARGPPPPPPPLPTELKRPPPDCLEPGSPFMTPAPPIKTPFASMWLTPPPFTFSPAGAYEFDPARIVPAGVMMR